MRPTSGLCVGIDPDLSRLPHHLKNSPKGLDTFIADVVDATRDVAACYKINVAFFERLGRAGMDALYAARQAVGSSYLILDAKRGDIGNTSAAYADAAFNDLTADAITVAPYMGHDSVGPFLERAGKMVYVLALTSNPGSLDFQRLVVDGEPLYRRVMRTVLEWERTADVGFVVGATRASELAGIRKEFADVPLLIPGVGAQGGDLADTVRYNAGGPAVLNVSRGLLYVSAEENYADAIRAEAEALALGMAGLQVPVA